MAIVRRDRGVFDLPDIWRRIFDSDADVLAGRWLRVEEFRDGDELVVRSELPGIDPENDLDISVADGVLTITAQRQERSEQKGKEEYRSEFRYGSFTRSIPLPPGVKEEDIKANYKDGILEIRIPVGAEPETGARKIPVLRG
jgi:HSP20 family protein